MASTLLVGRGIRGQKTCWLRWRKFPATLHICIFGGIGIRVSACIGTGLTDLSGRVMHRAGTFIPIVLLRAELHSQLLHLTGQHLNLLFKVCHCNFVRAKGKQ